MTSSRMLSLLVGAVVAASAASVSAAPADGRIVFSNNTDTPQVRGYVGSTGQFDANPTATVAKVTGQTWMVQRASPVRAERIVGYIAASTLYVMHSDATGAWTFDWSVGLNGGDLGRRFDIAYENVSGRALVVYHNGSSGTDELRYRIWNGTSWAAAASLDSARLTGIPNHVKLVSRPGRNELAAAISDRDNVLTSLIWDGSAWGDEPATAHTANLYRNANAGDCDSFDVAWSAQSGEVFVVFSEGSAGTGQQFHRRFSAGAWQAPVSWATGWKGPLQMFAATDPFTDQVLLGFNERQNSDIHARVWTGTSMKSVQTVGTGSVAPAVSQRTVHGAWVRVGGSSLPVLVWHGTGGGANGRIDFGVSLDGGTTFRQNLTATCGGTAPSAKAWIEASVDRSSPDSLLVAFSDTGSQLWAKRLTIDAAGDGTCFDADRGSALATTLSSTATQNFSFAFDRTQVIIGDGLAPADATACPQTAAVVLDAFNLKTATGTTTIDSVTVTFAAGTAEALGLVEITDANGATVYGSATAPIADVTTVTLQTPVSVGTTAKGMRVRVTPKAHSAMPAQPGKTYTVTGTVTSVAPVTELIAGDTASAMLTIDNLSTGAPTLNGTAGDASVALTWTAPSDADEVLVTRSSSSSTTPDLPAEGATYAVGEVIGSSTVVYVGLDTSFSDTGLTNGTEYVYRAFARDTCLNWSSAGSTSPLTPRPRRETKVGQGTDPADATFCPAGDATALDAFSLETAWAGDTDPVTKVTVKLAAGMWARLSLVEITDAGGNKVLGSAAPTADTVQVTTASGLVANRTLAEYRVRVTPKDHAAVPNGEYAIKGTVSAVTSGDPATMRDTASATLTLDGLAPGNVTGLSALPGDGEVALGWTNPAADLREVIVVRATGTTVAGAPQDGTTYTPGKSVGNGIVRYVGAGTSFTDNGLANGTTYHYKVFARDACANYATGVDSGAQQPSRTMTRVESGTDPASTTWCPGAGAAVVDGFAVATTRGTDTITGVTVTFAAGTASAVSLVEITDASGTTVLGSAVNPTADVLAMTLNPGIGVTTNSQDYAIRVTPKGHRDLPAPPGATVPIAARITDVVCTNQSAVADAVSSTLTLDNASLERPQLRGVQAGDARIELSWTNPADVSTVAVVRTSQATIGNPEEGKTYGVGESLGGGVVVYLGTGELFVDVGVANGTAYRYAVFAQDACGNWSGGELSAPATPSASTLTVGEAAAEPADARLCPGAGATDVDAFTLKTSRNSDTVTSVTITLTGGAAESVELVEVTSADGSTVYGSARRPTAEELAIELDRPITASTAETGYRLRITPRGHAAMPPLPGRTYEVGGRVTGVTSGFQKVFGDQASATLTLDNEAPANPAWVTYRAEASEVRLGWTNPVDADLATTMLVAASGPFDATPVEGEDYAVGAKIDGAEVKLKGLETEFLDTGVSVPQAMRYRLYARDTCGNYSSGATVGPEVVGADGGLAPVATEVYDLGGCGCGASGGPLGGLFALAVVSGALARRRSK